MAKFEIIEPSEEKFEEAIMILHNLRLFTTSWESAYKVPDKESKIYWENRADEWLKHNRRKIK